jgi:hypothetical protein
MGQMGGGERLQPRYIPLSTTNDFPILFLGSILTISGTALTGKCTVLLCCGCVSEISRHENRSYMKHNSQDPLIYIAGRG